MSSRSILDQLFGRHAVVVEGQGRLLRDANNLQVRDDVACARETCWSCLRVRKARCSRAPWRTVATSGAPGTRALSRTRLVSRTSGRATRGRRSSANGRMGGGGRLVHSSSHPECASSTACTCRRGQLQRRRGSLLLSFSAAWQTGVRPATERHRCPPPHPRPAQNAVSRLRQFRTCRVVGAALTYSSSSTTPPTISIPDASSICGPHECQHSSCKHPPSHSTKPDGRTRGTKA